MSKKIDDIEEFFEDISKTHPGKNRYLPEDRYREFRNLFLGSDLGKRVLNEIMNWGHMTTSTPYLAQFDPMKTMYFEGERNLTIRLLNTIQNEPRNPPAKAKE